MCFQLGEDEVHGWSGPCGGTRGCEQGGSALCDIRKVVIKAVINSFLVVLPGTDDMSSLKGPALQFGGGIVVTGGKDVGSDSDLPQ